jgi:hypothetical protein
MLQYNLINETILQRQSWNLDYCPHRLVSFVVAPNESVEADRKTALLDPQRCTIVRLKARCKRHWM